MQSYRLPYDNPHNKEDDSNSSHTLVFGNNAQIRVSQEYHIPTMEQNLNLNLLNILPNNSA